MKATISSDGTLEIRPETELEAYALKQWGFKSFPSGDPSRDGFPRMFVDCSGYADNARFDTRTDYRRV
ncbi:hypothetical protein ACFSHT_15815 [Paraburkholderia silviterrae]|uniref:Uncharacterized protein n=1 Tax=Paraburkholderia silviterrae TaxID=2528715 RepID=A0A4R5MAA1_9BURK|nr:hypothetical protein [Paraburkholderia silviterrae]TDG23240.1 hypothetical protein EYW47_15020 [Paraburkholderia silviterrae]